MGEQPDLPSAGAGRTAPAVGPPSSDQRPATKADLFAAVDTLRTDMRELLDGGRVLIQEARPTSPRQRFDDDEW